MGVGGRYVGGRWPTRDRPQIEATFAGTVVSVPVEVGEHVVVGSPVVVVESMKMEHLVTTEVTGTVRSVEVATGDVVETGGCWSSSSPATSEHDVAAEAEAVDLDAIRDDLADVLARQALLADDGPARGRREAPPDRTPHGAGEPGRPRRRRQLRGVRRAWPSPPSGLAATAGAAGAHAGRRAGRRHRSGQRRPLRRRRRPVCCRLLRLHRPRRHPGPAQPHEEGPAVRAGRAAAPAGRALRRGRRRPTRRHRLPGRLRPRLPGVRPVRRPERPGAARRHRVGPVLRRQRRAARAAATS